MRKPTLLILGGGSSQLSALRRARELGFSTLLADLNPRAQGRSLADGFIHASTFDSEAVLEGARRHEVHGILAIGSDQPVYTAARVAAALGLPHPLSPEQALCLTNKAVMKPLLVAAGLACPPFALIGPDRSQWPTAGLHRLRLPWVVKPVDSQGQRGIRVLHSREDLAGHLPVALGFSRAGQVIVEEFYQSDEMTVSGWVDETGSCELWSVSDRLTFPPEPGGGLGICLGHRYPARSARDCGPEVLRLCQAIVDRLGLRDVPIYFQFLNGKDGLVVNEIASRLGGAYEDEWVPLVSGTDILARQLAWYCRRYGLPEPDLLWPGQASSHALVPLVFARPGRIARLGRLEEPRGWPGVAALRWLQAEGTIIAGLRDSTQRLGYAVLHGGSAAEVNALVDRVFDRLVVVDDDGRSLLRDVRQALFFKE